MDWNIIHQSLNERGYAIVPGVLTPDECLHLANLYTKPDIFRSTINMRRYRFGEGEYKYFKYPLPEKIQAIRETWYPQLAILANDWMRILGVEVKFPEHHAQLIEQCAAKGQSRPTPLILRYETGGFNTLHQDLYGEVYFPFQAVFVLSEAGRDYNGGEFVLVEQIPRAQSKAEVIRPQQGDAVIFTTNFRPVKGSRGYYRANMKHGVSPLRSGVRYAMGIIFHDGL